MRAPLTPFILSIVLLTISSHNATAQASVHKPVAEYREPTGHAHGSLDVKLYETSMAMRYRVEVDYEGLRGDDTVKLPDLGAKPRPVLRKGDAPLSCIIGFLDNDNLFREVKLVYVTPKGNQFKITTLRHWHVSTHYRLVSN